MILFCLPDLEKSSSFYLQGPFLIIQALEEGKGRSQK